MLYMFFEASSMGSWVPQMIGFFTWDNMWWLCIHSTDTYCVPLQCICEPNGGPVRPYSFSYLLSSNVKRISSRRRLMPPRQLFMQQNLYDTR